MTEVEVIIIPRSTDKGDRWSVLVQDLEKILPEGFINTGQRVMVLQPGAIAGSHSHADTEALVALCPETTFIWIDKKGQRHEEQMYEDGEVRVFIIQPNVPHGPRNNNSFPVTLFEFSEEPHRELQLHPEIKNKQYS